MLEDKSVSFLLDPIECGETRCFSEKTKKLCRFVYTSHFGQNWICNLFEEKLLEDEEDCLKRCKQCLEAQNKAMGQ